MSDPYVEVRDRTGVTPSYCPETSKAEGQKGWYPRACCAWSPDIQLDLLYFFQRIEYPFRKYEEIPFKEPLRSEVRRFLISLDAYQESPNPVIPIRDILYGATKKDYATTLKRIKRKSFEKTWNVDEFEFPDWWNDVPWYPIKDIGDIFNYNYLIFWEGESDDYLWGKVPVNMQAGALEKFKFYVREVLPDRDEFEKISPTDILCQISGSISWDSKKRKKSPHYLLKNSRLYFADKIQPAKRSVIRVGPENIRDTVLLDPASLNTIALLDQQVMEIIRVVPGHIHLTDKDRATKRLKSLHKKCNLFIQRDLKKEGITKPRQLLKAMLEVLHELYPDIEIFEKSDFYDSFCIILEDDTEFIPNRGHGLGMANSLTTLMQLAIHDWIVDSLADNIPDMYGKCLCINDDFVVGFKDVYHLDSYWDREEEVLNSLSMLRAPDKSFTSEKHFVLAERYFTPHGEYRKVSYQLREILLPLACFNVCHAKSYFSATQLFIEADLAQKYITEIYSYWGYEFFPNEYLYPVIAGGWINETYERVDMSLKILDQLPYKTYVSRSFKACSAQIYRRGRGEIYQSPIVTLYGDPNIPEEYWGIFDIAPISLITEKYGRRLTHSREFFKNHWDKTYRVRQAVFKQPLDMPFERLVEEIVKSRPTVQYYPIDMMIKKYHSVNFSEIAIRRDPYLDPNPKLALISKYNSTQYPFKEEYSIKFTDRDNVHHKEFSLYPKETQRALKNEAITQFFTRNRIQIAWPSDGYDPHEDYINPIRLGICVSQLDWGFGYPEIEERFRSPLIEEKRSIFGRFFSLEELSEVVPYYSRRTLKEMVRVCQHVGISLISLHEQLQEDAYWKSYIPEPEIDSESESSHEPEMVMHDLDEIQKLVLEKNEYLFWNWRQDRDSVQINETTRYIWEQMDYVVTFLTFPGLAKSEEAKRLEVRSLMFHQHEGVRFFFRRIDWDSLINPPDMELAEEGGFDLFGGEDEW